MAERLRLEGLCHSFGALRVTDDVSLDLQESEIHALIGPNGAGKSTLIKLITGELRPQAGRVHLEGADLAGQGVAARARRGLARSFQVSSVIPAFSVADNVRLALLGARGGSYRIVPRRNFAAREVAEVIGEAGLAGLENRRAAQLGHGERRKLEIAMALALRPRVFVLDEPMAGMGSEGSVALGQLLRELKRRAPILLVEHDMDAVFALSDRISVLVYGRIIASGTVEEIRADPEVRCVYLGQSA